MGTSPTAVSTVKTPAAASRPKLAPANIKKKYFIVLSFSPRPMLLEYIENSFCKTGSFIQKKSVYHILVNTQTHYFQITQGIPKRSSENYSSQIGSKLIFISTSPLMPFTLPV